MSFKHLFKSLKDKGQDLASSAKKLLPSADEGVDDSLPATVPPPPPGPGVPPPPAPPPAASSSSGMVSRPSLPPPARPGSPSGAIVGMAPVLPPGPNDPARIAGLGRRGDPNAPIVENEVDDTFYQKKQGIVDDVDERFGRFGPRVSSYILTQSMLPNGLKMVLSKLELRPKGFDAGDKGQIEKWIEAHGPEEFARRVGLRLRDSDSASPLTANPPSEKSPSSSPVRVRQLQKPKGQFDSDLPGRGSSSSHPLPRPRMADPPSSSGRPLPPPAPPPPPPPAPSGTIAAPSGTIKEEPRKQLTPADLKPVALGEGPEFERRASMAKSPVAGEPGRGEGITPPPRPPPAAAPASPPPPPPPVASATPPPVAPVPPPAPPKLPQTILPPETEPDDGDQSKRAADFLKSALDESSRFQRRRKK